MEIIFGLMVLWAMGLGYALMVGRRRGAATYLGWSRDVASGALERVGQIVASPIRWGWRRHREAFIAFWLGLAIGLLLYLL